MKAIWNNQILAESDNTIELEGNHYFPPRSINPQNFEKSQTNTVCGWKGTASYYNIKVDGKTNPDAAWYYPEPKDAAINIKDYIAFWRGVEITK
jgi:uncharacterized protein (DUF427 family)